MVDQEPIPADWTYSTYCRKYLDESVYIPVQYRNAGYKQRSVWQDDTVFGCSLLRCQEIHLWLRSVCGNHPG
ncbi:hypothetical protein Y032_0089g2206 [Ancylostoma ceylanicum]|nr:hypothetical protein Y032_0089g2206 [Ancylostoma ceylanicum]